MRVEEYIPPMISGFEPKVCHFDTLDQLLEEIDWIKEKANRLNTKDIFYQFSLIRDTGNKIRKQHMLMAEYNGGKDYWVIGFIRDYDIRILEDLPEFNPVEVGCGTDRGK